MNKLLLPASLLAGVSLLAGCANNPPCYNQDSRLATVSSCATPQACPPATVQPPALVARAVQRTVKLTAIGYGASSSFEGYSLGQKRLMAMRASKLDAYRALVEQIYGVRVVGNSTVSAMAAQNDSFRVYVDAFVRGSRVVSVTPMADGNYETVLEIDLDQGFRDYFNKGAGMVTSGDVPSPCGGYKGSVGSGCAYGANFYYSE